MSINFIFHIGPIKTGSTSIQKFLETIENTSPNLGYKRIRPAQFYALSSQEKRKESFQYFQDLYKRKIRRKKTIKTMVLSHECMYQAPESIPHLIETAKPFAKKVGFIAYARRQSNHYRSHYSQFLYFDRALQHAVNRCFENNNLDINYFTGLEAFLSALALSEFKIVKGRSSKEYQNWTRMIQIDRALRNKGHHLELGLLPGRTQNLSLIQDFCTRSGINNSEGSSTYKDLVVHEALPDVAVELLYQAVRSGLKIPAKKPEHLPCYKAFRQKEFKNDSLQIHDAELIKQLMSYIDSHYIESNYTLCNYFDLPTEYFKPKEFIDQKRIIQYIKETNAQRKENSIERLELKNKILCECARYFMLGDADAGADRKLHFDRAPGWP